MKKIARFILALFIIAGCNSENNPDSNPASENLVRINGSESVEPLVNAILDDFTRDNPSVKTEYQVTGSPKGISLLIEKKCDITFISRDLKLSEENSLNAVGPFEKRVIGYDGISMIVNSKNKTEFLTKIQLSKIFSGEILNWMEVGGEDLPIKIINRDTLSGTRDFFGEIVMDQAQVPDIGLTLHTKEEVIKNIEETPGAIGYISGTIANLKLKTLKIVFKNEPVLISPQNVKLGAYPLARPFYCVYYKFHQVGTEAFLNYLTTDNAKEKVFVSGLIPVAN